MTEADKLTQFLLARRMPDADRDAIDASIFAHFGCTQAVMFTDLVGFSRSVEAFGIIHFLQMIQESESVFLPLIDGHRGTCVKREGDSLLVLFDQPTDALAAAKAMVAATVALNVGRAPEDRIEVCIGLGYGQVLRVGHEDVWGAQVNAASKLGEDMAAGGEVLVTQFFHQALPDGADTGFAEYGTLFGTQKVFRLAAIGGADR